MRRLIAALVAILAIGLCASPAHAAAIEPSKSADAAAALIQGQLITDPAVANNLISAYWTPQRMRMAVPVDPQSIDDPALEAADRPGNIGREEAGALPVAAPPTMSAQAVNASPGVGKVFFTNAKNGKDYVCSGSTINNPGLNMVNTAGHCVHGGKGGTWHQNWAYVPYYDHGAAPYGTWAAKWFTTVKGWTKHSYSWWDFGFVNVWPKNGTKLVSTTGGNGLYFNYSKWIDVTVLAYPSGAPFDGQWQISCLNNLYPYGSQQVGFNCLMTKGSSGGPFLYQYDNSIRFGLVASNIAHGPDTKSYGPYYDNDVKDIYNVAKNKV